MSDTEDIKNANPETAPTEELPDLSGLGTFDFTPDWAKGKPEDGLKKFRGERFSEEREERRDDRRGGQRKSFGDRKPSGERKPFGERKQFGDRKPFDRGQKPAFRRDDAPRFAPPPKPLDCEVRVLPEQKALGSIIRKIQTSYRAFPLKDIAYLFLDNPASCLLRVSAPKGGTLDVWQCKHCGMPALSEEEIVSHVLAAHMPDYYERVELDCEPPKGNFSCVAKCGLSGEFIGPSNLHDFNAKVHDLMRRRYPSMSEDEFRSHLVMLRDPESIEEWRKGATKKTVYRRKGEVAQSAPAAEGVEAPAATDSAPALEREQAELEFHRTILPTLVVKPKNLVTTAQAGLKTPSRPLLFALRDALRKEERFPASLFFALRGAFHHRKLEFFRANDPRGQEFVTAVKFTPLDAQHAIPVLTAIVKFVENHPGITISALVPAICAGDDSMRDEVVKNLSILIERGHLVAFHDDQLQIPSPHPPYRRLPKDKKPAEGAEEKKAEAPTTETPAVETPAAEPAPEAPVAEAPVSEPAPEAQVAEPAPEAPASEPAPEAPASEPAPEAPVAEAPVAEVPAAETAPEAPAAEAPAAEPAQETTEKSE